MLFAQLKRILKLDRLGLRGPNGARDEFLLAATDQACPPARRATGGSPTDAGKSWSRSAFSVPFRERCGEQIAPGGRVNDNYRWLPTACNQSAQKSIDLSKWAIGPKVGYVASMSHGAGGNLPAQSVADRSCVDFDLMVMQHEEALSAEWTRHKRLKLREKSGSGGGT